MPCHVPINKLLTTIKYLTAADQLNNLSVLLTERQSALQKGLK